MSASSDSDFAESSSSSKRSKKAIKSKKAKKSKRSKSPEIDINSCVHCRQRLIENDNLQFFQNPPEGAEDECMAMFKVNNPATDDMDPEDPRPEFRATQVQPIIITN